MVAANRLHATLDLSLPIQLRGRYPLVKLELFHQELSRRHLTHFRYLHRVLSPSHKRPYSISVFSAEKPRVLPRIFLSFQ